MKAKDCFNLTFTAKENTENETEVKYNVICTLKIEITLCLQCLLLLCLMENQNLKVKSCPSGDKLIHD